MEIIYYVSIALFYSMALISAFMIAFAFITHRRRRFKLNGVFLSSLFLLFPGILLTFYYIITIASFFKPFYCETGVLIMLMVFLIVSILANILLWIYVHFSIEVYSDRFVFNHCFHGNTMIKYADMDLSQTKILIVKRKFLGSFDYLAIKLNNGDEHNFLIDIPLFFTTNSLLLKKLRIDFKLKTEYSKNKRR